MRTAKTFGGIAVVCALLAAGLLVGIKYDLTVAQALLPLWQQGAAQHAAGEGSVWYVWAILAEALGSLPAFACMPMLGWCLCCGEGRHLLARSRLRQPARFWVGLALILAGSITVACSALHYFAKREFYTVGIFGRILWGLALAAVILVWSMLSHRSAAALHRGQALGIAWCLFSLLQCGIIQLLKAIWQRSRFDHMAAAGDFSAYTPWLQLPGNGGDAFPSGHTGAAGVLLVLTVGCLLFESMREDEPGWLFLGYSFALAVGFGRMLAGRHYLSDVCMALLIDSLLLLIALTVFTCLRKKYGAPAPSTDNTQK